MKFYPGLYGLLIKSFAKKGKETKIVCHHKIHKHVVPLKNQVPNQNALPNIYFVNNEELYLFKFGVATNKVGTNTVSLLVGCSCIMLHCEVSLLQS